MLSRSVANMASVWSVRAAAPLVGRARCPGVVPGGLRFMCEKGAGDEKTPVVTAKPQEDGDATSSGEGAPMQRRSTSSYKPSLLYSNFAGKPLTSSYSSAPRPQRVYPREMPAAGGGPEGWPDEKPEGWPDGGPYDPVHLEKLGISHIPSWRIAKVLADEDITLEELVPLIEQGFHLMAEEDEPDDRDYVPRRAPGPPGPPVEDDPNVWSLAKHTQLLPRRKFFPGQTYDPQELSPNHKVDWGKLKKDFVPQSCPLGGPKGPPVDWTNVGLLSRYLTEGGQIKPRRQTKVCLTKQVELANAVRRARTMALLGRTKRGVPTPVASSYSDFKSDAVYERDRS